jgi:hypothetical protein
MPATGQPVPPCSSDDVSIVPFYGEIGEPPAVGVWRDIELSGREACLGRVRGRMELVIALAGRFEGFISLDDIVSRIGAISGYKDLPYWSTTEQQWRTLIAETYALDDPASGLRRSDFSVREVLSGQALYFGQNDTRSTGMNVYRLSARLVAPEHLLFETVNLSRIKFAFVPIFEPYALRSLHFVDRLDGGKWGYYGIFAVQSGAVDGQEKSFINRASAFYRHLIGAPTTKMPPLAP